MQRVVIVPLLLMLLSSAAMHGQENTGVDVLPILLEKHIGLTPPEFDAMKRGKVVTKVLETDSKEEVAVFGVTWIDAPIDFFLEKYRDIESFESGNNVEAIGTISDPPQLQDFAELTLPEDDIKDIKKCKPGKCNVKMSEEAMARFQNDVDWSAADAEAQANAVLRELAAEHARAYLEGGNGELGKYQDKKKSQALADEFHELLASSPYLPEYVPELRRHLEDFPNAELPNSTDFLYWSRVKFGLKPMIRLNHVTIYRDSDEQSADAIIASKALYSSHYFRAALELRFLLRDLDNPERQGFYLVSVNRARADGMTGVTGALLGSTIRERSRQGLETFLTVAKRKFASNN